jgi:hypothetical protein
VLFEQFKAGPLDCARKLAERLGLAFDETKVSEGVRNPGLNHNALRVMRAYNLFAARKTRDKFYLIHIPGLFEVRKKLHRRLNKLFRKKSGSEALLGQETVRWIEARYAPSNRELAELLGIDIGAFGYPVVTPETPPPSPLPHGRKLRAT